MCNLQNIIGMLPDHYSISSTTDLGGGQSSVFIGEYHGQRAAIKIFNFENQANKQRVERELEFLRDASCPNLVTVLGYDEFGIDGNQTFVVAYEYHPGGNIRDLCREGAVREDIISVAECCLRAIEVMWARRIVHRDIKPENIVRAMDGRYVLVDLGLAKHLNLSAVTPSLAAPGTIGYRSPEQLSGNKHLTYKSDLFCLGIVLYELATGRHPYARIETMVGVHRPKSISDLVDNFDSELEGLIFAMLSTAPVRRPSNARDILKNIK